MPRRSFIVVFCCFLLCIVLFMNYKMQRSLLYDTYAKQRETNKGYTTNRKNDKSGSDTVSNIRTDFKFANPSEDDVAKLTNEYIPLESVTDPLKLSSDVCNKKHFLLVVVISHPKSRERRDQIRNSWGYSYHDDVNLLSKVKKFQDGEFKMEDVFRMVFVMGKSRDQELMKSVYEEADNFKDIVFGDLVENYKNLTLKTRLALKWAYYDCKSTYVLKTDDDVFINPVPLVEWLKEKPKTNLYTGYCNFNSPVIRDKRNKWYVSFEDYAKTNFPGYCLGGGYLLSSDLVDAFLKASYGRKYFPMEDLYVGLLINEMKTVKIRDERNHFVLNYEPVKEDCKMNDLFLAHRVLGKQLQIHIERSRTALQKCQHNHW